MKQSKLAAVLLSVMPFLWGLFYEFSVFLCGSILSIILIERILRRNRLVYSVHYTNIAFVVFILGYWVSIFFAVDKGLAFTGACRFTVPGIFLLVLMQIEQEQREAYIRAIPCIGIVMLGVSLVGGIFESSRQYFFQAGRLGGIFQYSNTMALFFLVGIVVLCFKCNKDKKVWIEIIVLVMGILLTGSRTVFFLMVLFFLCLAIKETKMRKGIICLIGLVVLISVSYVAITKDYQNIGRYLSSSFTSSTLVGRILYNIDGIKILSQNMRGVGYKGYSILQPLIQTGDYTTRYVHNDWLQIALDAGVLAVVAFAVTVIGNIISSKTCIRNKCVLILIAIHMLVDFDLQYVVMFGVLLLMFPFEDVKREIVVKRRTSYIKVVFGLLPICLLYGFLSIPYFFYHIGEYDKANMLYPYDTEIKTACMLNSSNMTEAEKLADEIIASNKYSYAAWNIKAVAELEKGNYQDMIQFKKKGLAITRYDIREYQDYIVMLNKAINASEGSEREGYISDLLLVEEQIKSVLEQTNDLAYQIKDKPELELESEYKEFIQFYREERKEKE